MKIDFNSIKPIYIQISEIIEEDILSGKLKEKEPVYSQQMLSKELGINPATAAKGIHMLVEKGILKKQRGLSMIVSSGAKNQLITERYNQNFMLTVNQLITEAIQLKISKDQLISLIQELYQVPPQAEDRSKDE